MRVLHLKQINGNWHYQRRRPAEFEEVEPRKLIRFSLKTRDYAIARAHTAQISLGLDQQWKEATDRKICLTGGGKNERFVQAQSDVKIHGFPYKHHERFTEDELIHRLRIILKEPDLDKAHHEAVLDLSRFYSQKSWFLFDFQVHFPLYKALANDNLESRIGVKRSMRPHLASLKSSVFVLAAALLAACAGADVSEAKWVVACSKFME